MCSVSRKELGTHLVKNYLAASHKYRLLILLEKEATKYNLLGNLCQIYTCEMHYGMYRPNSGMAVCTHYDESYILH